MKAARKETAKDDGSGKTGKGPGGKEDDVRDCGVVHGEVLATKGAVSSECAAAMAEGARRLLKTDLAVSLTGIAGPGGGTAEKPVGLVWFGLASGGSRSRATVITEKKVFPGDREAVRTAAIEHALNLLLDAVRK